MESVKLTIIVYMKGETGVFFLRDSVILFLIGFDWLSTNFTSFKKVIYLLICQKNIKLFSANILLADV